MVKNFEELVSLCEEELRHREYHSAYYDQLCSQWSALHLWMQGKGYEEFNEEIGNRYLTETFGTHLLPPKTKDSIRVVYRAVRMLISYQKAEEFEFRCPRVEYTFEGPIGQIAFEYLEYCRYERRQAQKTLDNKRNYLYAFSSYMDTLLLSFSDLSTEIIEKFFKEKGYPLSSRHNGAQVIRNFLRYAYDVGRADKDYSVYVTRDNYRKDCKIPTTYEEHEIRAMLNAVERASAIGKRDYLILLLAAEYGWRAKDITEFRFDQIDWDHNVIRFEQSKTDVPVEFPLLASVGNAIIDYLKYARPESNSPEVIVSMNHESFGKPLKSPTIHSVVTRYLRKAEIKDWSKKKHGPHSMRHSLATNLLKKNVALPIISTVMGHQRTETTSVYVSVDYDKLKKCALPMPPLHSPLYCKEGSNGKV